MKVELIVYPRGADKVLLFPIDSRYWGQLWKSLEFKPKVQPRYIIHFWNQHWVLFQDIIKQLDSHWKKFQHGDFYGKILKLKLLPNLYFQFNYFKTYIKWKFNMSSFNTYFHICPRSYSFSCRHGLCKPPIFSYFYKKYLLELQGRKIFPTWYFLMLFTEFKYLQPFKSISRSSTPGFFWLR